MVCFSVSGKNEECMKRGRSRLQNEKGELLLPPSPWSKGKKTSSKSRGKGESGAGGSVEVSRNSIAARSGGQNHPKDVTNLIQSPRKTIRNDSRLSEKAKNTVKRSPEAGSLNYDAGKLKGLGDDQGEERKKQQTREVKRELVDYNKARRNES